MIINGKTLLRMSPIKDMLEDKERHNGVSHGLAEAGYDIRVKQDVTFARQPNGEMRIDVSRDDGDYTTTYGCNFTLASAIEEFQMPQRLVGTVKDKSTWARKGLSVFNTVIEPGWNGFLTLELVYHGSDDYMHIPGGTGIAQVLFSSTIEAGDYADGKYQNAEDKIQGALHV